MSAASVGDAALMDADGVEPLKPAKVGVPVMVRVCTAAMADRRGQAVGNREQTALIDEGGATIAIAP